ncbi:MAG: alpha/beta hydrolase [Rhodospirillales bacterium]|nr:MAG: alpha/beta hydrolase [Rhodospirillales bacterium]
MNFARDYRPNLEVLHREPEGDVTAGRPPLLFVHGGFVGAWCWAEKFLDWFAARGWECCAPSLRGHGASDGEAELHAYGIDDYVTDVVRVAEALHGPPILVGHSMGGFVVQRYMERHPAMAAVLMAPVPAMGLCGAGFALAATNPGLFVDLALAHELGRLAPTPAVLFEVVFGHEVDSSFEGYGQRFTDESHRAWMEMCEPSFIDTSRIPDLPLMVIGGSEDHIIPPAFIRSAARVLGTTAEILPGLGHALMLESGWDEVAERIDGWLRAQGF